GLMAKAEQAFRDALKVPVPAGSGWVYYDDYRGEAQKRLRMLLEQQGKPVLAEDLYPWLYARHDDEKHGPFAAYGDADSSLAAHVTGPIEGFRAHLEAEGIRADVPPPSIFIDARNFMNDMRAFWHPSVNQIQIGATLATDPAAVCRAYCHCLLLTSKPAY